jgi:thiamine monophosphate kinase
MMDVSDGIATDLPRLLKASRAGAVIEAARLPVSGAVRRLAATPSQPAPPDLGSARLHALTDCEEIHNRPSAFVRRLQKKRLSGILCSRRTEGGGVSSILSHALCDGEDFELLFTTPAARGPALEKAWSRRFRLPLSRIGVITNRAGVLELLGVDGHRSRLTARGFEHFSNAPAPRPTEARQRKHRGEVTPAPRDAAPRRRGA